MLSYTDTLKMKCYGCFKTIKDNEVFCHYCGYRTKDNETPKWILPPGTVLNGKYEIGRSLGEGGFGITYLAWDINMETKIAIKEYFPTSAVSRDTAATDGNRITKNTTSGSMDFDTGLKRYVKEASILSKFFDLPGIVSVKDFFYENETAYFVMEYIEGMSLKDYLATQNEVIGYEEAIALMQPVISSLHVIHGQHLLHRDISPDNIMIGNDGGIKLIDFGAARSMDQAADNGMTVMLKHGYAPIEQYSRNGAQGAYTDVYGVCAVLYRMITGKIPVDATDRASAGNVKTDLLVPISKLTKKVPKHISQAIEKGLSLMPEHRQKDMQELYDELYISRKGVIEKKAAGAYSVLIKCLVAVSAVLILTAILAMVYLFNYDKFEKYRNAAAILSGKEIEYDTGYVPDDEDADKKKNSGENASKSEDDTDTEDNADVSSESEKNVLKTEEAESERMMPNPEEDIEPEEEIFPSENGAEYDEEVETAIDAVKNGIMDSSNVPVQDMFARYSDTSGVWEGYREADGSIKVQYSGVKDGSSFSVIFEITSNRSDTNQIYIGFRVAGATKNGEKIDEYNEFFKGIMDSY